MKAFYIAVLTIVYSLICIGSVTAESNTLKGIKLGLGFDRGFGVVGTMKSFNGFLGDDGIAIDYIFNKEKLDIANPLYWYIGTGGFIDWNGDFGARLPIGGEFYFAKNLDVYVQAIPRIRFDNDNNDKNDKNDDDVDFGLDLGIGVRYQF